MAMTLASLVAAPARAQVGVDPLFGQPVAAVKFELEGEPIDGAPLAPLVEVKAGVPLTREAVRTSLARLIARGTYDDVVPVAMPTASGIEVTFRLVPRHPIDKVDVVIEDGAPIAASALRDMVLQRYGGVASGVSREAIVRAATQFLNDQGYLAAEVSAVVVPTHAPEGATLTLTVTGGPLVAVRQARVEGDSPLSSAEILRRVGAEVGAPYRQRELESALTGIQDDLRARHYYQAVVTHRSVRGPDGMDVTIRIALGPLVQLVIDPPGLLKASQIAEFIPIAREGSVDQDLLEDSSARIEQWLRTEGYWKGKAPFVPDPSPDGRTLTITYHLDRGPRYYIDHLELPVGLSLPSEDVRQLVTVKPGAIFSEAQFEASIATVIAEYTRRGYYQAEAKPEIDVVEARTTGTEAWVVLHPNITEGPKGTVSAVTFTFAATPKMNEAQLRAAMQSKPGAPYVRSEMLSDQVRLRTLYADQGFGTATVRVAPAASEDGAQVSLAVAIDEGPQTIVGDIAVVGNAKVRESVILDTIELRVGQPYGLSAREKSLTNLRDMGVFRRSSIDLADTGATGAPARVVVSVVENKSTSLGFGGGIEGGMLPREVNGVVEDHIFITPRGFFEIGRRNLGGHNRSIDFFSRLALQPRKVSIDNSSVPGFTEYRVSALFRERRVWRQDADLLIGITSEQAARSSFNFLRQTINAEYLRRITPAFNISGRYGLDFTKLFDELIDPEDRPDIDRLFSQVRLSTLSTGLLWDRRDNVLAPTRGTLVTSDFEVAAQVIGSEVGYGKTYFQGVGFRSLTKDSKTVLALRGQIGLAKGFPREATEVDEDGNPIIGPDGQEVKTIVRDLPASVRFYAGGGTTVRGFQLDRLGVPEILKNGISTGGNGVVVLNAEIRRTVGKLFKRDFGVVGFVDGGNVFARASDVDLGRLRGTVGFGGRYNSPLGPIRVDFGFKTDRQIVNGRRERGMEWHLSIGEAF
jgi:outer membrane protein insertion porin family